MNPASNLPAVPAGESVRGLVSRIRALLKSSLGTELVLHGIVSGCRGAGYLDLQDEEDGRLSISISYYGNERVFAPLIEAGFPLQDGLPVMLRGYATLSNARSQVRFMVSGVVPQYTRGVLKSHRDETNERLIKEGVFDAQQKVRFPLLPRVLGVVTSDRGVVFEDVAKALSAARTTFQYVWIRCAVQGADAAREMARAVRELDRDPRVDVICLFRGGGSALELDAFNAYELARAICDCRRPVLAAVGHRNDECSAQDAAFKNCHTPSLLGEFLASRIDGLRQRVTDWTESIARRCRERHRGHRQDVQILAGRCREGIGTLVRCQHERILRQYDRVRLQSTSLVRQTRRRILEIAAQVPVRSRAACGRKRAELARTRGWVVRALGFVLGMRSRAEVHLARIIAADPVTQLARGFAIVRRENGTIITRAALLDQVASARLQMQDGMRTISVSQPPPQ